MYQPRDTHCGRQTHEASSYARNLPEATKKKTGCVLRRFNQISRWIASYVIGNTIYIVLLLVLIFNCHMATALDRLLTHKHRQNKITENPLAGTI